MKTLPYDLDSTSTLLLNGCDLKIEEVVAVARLGRPVAIDPEAERRVGRCRKMVEVLLGENEKVYGLTTGFGKLRDVVIPVEDTAKLQKNLIMSHSCGVGEPFTEEVVRAMILLRANTLCRGNSGIRVAVIEQLIHMLNDGVYPYVPEKGSVGASGDLTPLSHLGLVLIGHSDGRYMPKAGRLAGGQAGADPSHPREGDFAGMPGDDDQLEQVAEREGWKSFRPIPLEAKEGLAINNGTQPMTAVACLAVYDGFYALRFAELAGALSLEAQRGVRNAYDPRLHDVRPQSYQQDVAQRVIGYCEGSQIIDLYLNSAHLGSAGRCLREAEEFLAQVAADVEAAGSSEPLTVRTAREELHALADELSRIIPTGDDGKPDAELIADRSAMPPRRQIARFDRLLRPLRERATGLLRDVDSETFPDTEASSRVRSSLVAAVKHLAAAVPDSPLVQDDYSFRCFPQVLACAHRTLDHAHGIVSTEINSATDNPLLFPPEGEGSPEDPDAYAEWLRADPERIEECKASVLGGGNFHGEPIAVVMDYFAIAMAEVASIAERRVAHLTDENHSQGLPSFLIDASGLNSGFMIPQYTAAALVSENKVLCHPASVDSIPTCANTEDHVSMGTIAARKAAEVLGNVLDVISIEILTAYQGLKFRLPLEPGVRLRQVVEVLAENGVDRYEDDRVPYPDFRRIRELMGEGVLLGCLA